MTTANYSCIRTGPGRHDWRLVPHFTIETRDARDPLWGSGRRAPSTKEVIRNLDELLTGPEPTKRLQLGARYTANSNEPELDDLLAPIQDFVNHQFSAGHVVHADVAPGVEDPLAVIHLGKVFLPNLTGAERAVMEQRITKAEDMLRRKIARDATRPLRDADYTDPLAESVRSMDARRGPGIARQRPFGGFGQPMTPAQYQANLAKAQPQDAHGESFETWVATQVRDAREGSVQTLDRQSALTAPSNPTAAYAETMRQYRMSRGS